MSAEPRARYWLLSGRVQGVGFRPFVHQLARRRGLEGWVRNLAGPVEILAQGAADDLERFAHALLGEAPPGAAPVIDIERECTPRALSGFEIRLSTAAGGEAHLPADRFACPQCLEELRDPANRRYRYPFISCAHCGPRFTVIRALPYDRANTSLDRFTLCPDCQREYQDPADRRFHAETNACPRCGPGVSYRDDGGEARGAAALDAAVNALRDGRILAVKGVGGYHLMVNARDEKAVARLRDRKHRPDKPLAVMVPESALAHLNADDRAFLAAPARPILLCPKHEVDLDLAAGIAPDCPDLGVMLPSSPLHQLLIDDIGDALVATSGNLSGAPLVTDNDDAHRRLSAVADAFLDHDRPILRAADDPVYRRVAGRPRLLRTGRGVAPLEWALPRPLRKPALALGGHLKPTIALGWGTRAVISQHLGDQDHPRARERLAQSAREWQRLHGQDARELLCDAHPDGASRQLADRFGQAHPLFHHYCHASALAGEYPGDTPWLVFAWDGVGYGADGTLWGGEALHGGPGHWHRLAGFRRFRPPGGEAAARDPWRSALAVCWETDRDWAPPLNPLDLALIRGAWERRLNCPATGAIGRLFDAAAALLGYTGHSSFEGQAPMWLEAISTGEPVRQALPLPLHRNDLGLWHSDWSPLLPMLLDDSRPVAERAARFHDSLAGALLDQARVLRGEKGGFRIGLTGGVFQNRRLAETVMAGARGAGFEVFLPEHLPVNDAGLSIGQLIEYGASR